MSSNINPYNIDGTFPVAGQNNSSQGFRDNFTNIRNNFSFAESELTDLQNKALTTSALNGQTLNNDMAGTQIFRPQLSAWTQTLFDNEVTSGSLILNFNQANFQKFTTLGPVTLSFINWPVLANGTSQSYGSMRIWAVVTDTAHTITFPRNVNIAINDIAGYDPTTNTVTFDTPGNYVFDVSSVDGGSNFLIFDYTRNRASFSDPALYLNKRISNTLFLGYTPKTLPTALALESGADTLSMVGSINSVAAANNYTGNVYVTETDESTSPGISVTTVRGNLETGVFNTIQNNDFLGYVNALTFAGASLTPTCMASMAFYARGISQTGAIGGNVAFFTAPDDQPELLENFSQQQVIGFENDQSTQLYGNLILSQTGTTSSYVPAHNTSHGVPGQVAWDASYFYVCVTSNSWKRVALSSTAW
jgi:hypothetical protein